MNDDLNRNTAFEPFYENFVGPAKMGMSAVRYDLPRPTPRQLLRRFWRQSIVPQPWKPCVPVACPPLEEYRFSADFFECHNGR